MSKITDDVMTEERALVLMRKRILETEKDNDKSNAKSPAQMIDAIRKIIEEEADQSCF
jgi:hypothetical protein